MATFRLTDTGGAEYEIDAPDEHAAIGALTAMKGGSKQAPSMPQPAMPQASAMPSQPAINSQPNVPQSNPATAFGAMGSEALPSEADIPGNDSGPMPAILKGAAYGVPFVDRAGAALQAGLDKFRGEGEFGSDGTFGKNYDLALQDIRRRKEENIQDHPVAARVGGVIGGVASTVPLLAAAGITGPAAGAGMLARVFSGAGIGGGVGSVQGLSDSPDLTDAGATLKSTAIGTATGALLGGSMPIAAKGIGLGYNALANALTGNASGISRSIQPHLLSAMQADGPEAIAAALQRLGPDATMADAGTAMLGKAQGAVLNNDKARSVLMDTLNARKDGANARIQGDVNAAIGPAEDPLIAQQNILDHRTAVDNVNYGAAKQGAPPVDTTGVLADIGMQLKTAEGMQKKALLNLRDSLMETVERPVLDANGKQVMARDANNNPYPLTAPKLVPKTNVENLHNIRQDMDNVINYDAPGLGVPAGAVSRQQGALKMARGSLDDALKSQVPGFAEADATSSALASRVNAVKLGTSVLDSGKTALTPENLGRQLANMAPGERVALAKGTRGEIERLLDTKANDLVAGKNIIKGDGDWNRQRLGMVFGQDPADSVINSVGREAVFANTHNKVVEGAQTAMRLAAKESMKPTPSSEIPMINPNMSIPGLVGTALKKGGSALYNALTKSDPTAQYGELGQILAAQGPQRDKYVSALVDALNRRSSNAAAAPAMGNNTALGAALLGGEGLRDQYEQRRRLGR